MKVSADSWAPSASRAWSPRSGCPRPVGYSATRDEAAFDGRIVAARFGDEYLELDDIGIGLEDFGWDLESVHGGREVDGEPADE